MRKATKPRARTRRKYLEGQVFAPEQLQLLAQGRKLMAALAIPFLRDAQSSGSTATIAAVGAQARRQRHG